MKIICMLQKGSRTWEVDAVWRDIRLFLAYWTITVEAACFFPDCEHPGLSSGSLVSQSCNRRQHGDRARERNPTNQQRYVRNSIENHKSNSNFTEKGQIYQLLCKSTQILA